MLPQLPVVYSSEGKSQSLKPSEKQPQPILFSVRAGLQNTHQGKGMLLTFIKGKSNSGEVWIAIYMQVRATKDKERAYSVEKDGGLTVLETGQSEREREDWDSKIIDLPHLRVHIVFISTEILRSLSGCFVS